MVVLVVVVSLLYRGHLKEGLEGKQKWMMVVEQEK